MNVGLGLTDSGIGINASYHPKHGLSGGIGVKSDLGVAAGLNFSRDGPSAYAGMVLNEEGTQSAGISYSRDEGAGAYFERGFTESGSGRLTFNQRDGFGAGLQIDNVDMSISERGGASIEATVALDDLGFEEDGPTGYNQNSNLRMGYNTKRGYNVNLDVTTAFNDGGDGFSGSIGYQQHQGLTSSINTDLNRNFSAGSEYMISSQAGLRGTVSGIAAQKQKEYQEQKKMAWLEERWDLLEAADPDKYNAATRAAILSDPDAFSDALHDAGVLDTLTTGELNGASNTTRGDGLWDSIAGGFEDAYRGAILGEISDSDGFIDENGNYRQRTCFVAGTKVRTTDGYTDIEKLNAGDRVLSWNEVTGEKSYSTITQTFIHTVQEIYVIRYEDGTKIEATWNHPFYIFGKGWVQVKNLHPGDDSFTAASGRYLRIANIKIERRQEKVYNIHLDKDHTYFVTHADVLVHNYDIRTGLVENGDTMHSIRDQINHAYGTDYTLDDLAKMNGMIQLSSTCGTDVECEGLQREGQNIIAPEQYLALSEEQRDAFFENKLNSCNLQSSLLTGTIGGGVLYGRYWDAGIATETRNIGIYNRTRSQYIATSNGAMGAFADLTLGGQFQAVFNDATLEDLVDGNKSYVIHEFDTGPITLGPILDSQSTNPTAKGFVLSGGFSASGGYSYYKSESEQSMPGGRTPPEVETLYKGSIDKEYSMTRWPLRIINGGFEEIHDL